MTPIPCHHAVMEVPARQAVREITFVHQLPLNESNPDLLVNFLQYAEYDADGKPLKLFSWVTDLTITRDNALHLTRGGRSALENRERNVQHAQEPRLPI